jgi:hypothetical protein
MIAMLVRLATGLLLLLAVSPTEPVSALQTATRLLDALKAGELAKAEGFCLTGAQFSSLSKHNKDADAYQERLKGFLRSLAQALANEVDFKEARVGDVLILPESEKNRELLLAVVHVFLVFKDGKPIDAPEVFTFVRMGAEWKFLMR